MKAAYASLISLAVLAAALSLFGRPSATTNPRLADTGDGIAATDTMPDRNQRSRVETADSTAETPADSTCEEGWTRDAANFADGVIQAPEQPEATAFAPTMMGDIEAASPTAGISVIAPPSANSRGTASLQYPFIMPPARNGMKPSLGLAYDSDAGDGICGEGWTLPIPSITVDTRWGVPRYDMEHETETYLMDGQMLAMQVGDSLYLAHRHPGIQRNIADTLRRYHPRTGTDFSLIERVGASPASYYWRVTAPDGTLYTYGEGNAVLKDTITDISGNRREVIAEWLLSEIMEPHGDYITYHYHTTNDTVIGGLRSRTVYLDTVRAGNAEGPMHTVVMLHYRNRDGASMHTCNARYGFLTSSRLLLDSVAVSFSNTLLRSYGLQYSIGRFGKPLLSRVTHYDDEGNAASFQTFGYHDDVGGSASGMPLFQTGATDIPTLSTDVAAEFAKSIEDAGGFSQHPSAIDGNVGKSMGVSLYAGVGFGVSNDKANTAGISAGYSRSTTRGGLTLADLNGDGMPDQVFRRGGGTYYRPMVANDAGISFGQTVQVQGAADFSKTVTTSITGGLKVHSGIGKVGVAETGVDLMFGTSKTTAYMADVNADGMVDIVCDGRVCFGYLDTGGTPAFSTTSTATVNPIGSSAAFVIDEDSLLADERDTLVKYSPMQDIVRMWKAPFGGMVDITGTARLLLPANLTDENGDAVSPDGVHVSIQKGASVLYSVQLDSTTTQVQTNAGNVTVSEGDTIFFRVQCGTDSLSNGWHDKVLWNQTVKYVGQGLSYPTMPNGESQNIYRSKEAAFVSSGAPIDVGGNSFSVKGTFGKVSTTDSVWVRIWTMNEQYDTLGNPNPNFHRHLQHAWPFGHLSALQQLNWTIPNLGADPYAVCEIYSPSNVDWNTISWMPEVIADGDTMAVVPHYATYPVQRWRGIPYKAPSADSLTITPLLSVSGTHSINMTVKKRGTCFARKRLDFNNGILSTPDSTVRIKPVANDSIWVEYFVEDSVATACLSQPMARFKPDGGILQEKPCNLYHQHPEDTFGTMYKGWGAFSYGAGNGRHAASIDRSLLRLPADSSACNPFGLAFTPLLPRTQNGRTAWMGANGNIYVCGDTLSAARLLVNDVNPQPNMSAMDRTGQDGGEARGITLRTKSSSLALMEGGGVPPLRLTTSTSNGESSSSTAFTDMNGDGYPDIITGGAIHYTNTLGGFTNETFEWFGNTEEAASKQEAAGLGATPQHAHTLSGMKKEGSAQTSVQQAANAGCDFDLSLDNPQGSDSVAVMLADVNGDGLPDRVRKGSGKVMASLNLGYFFTGEVELASLDRPMESTGNDGLSLSAGVSLPTGYDHGATSFSGGLSTAASRWTSRNTLTDINGDGLPDLLWLSGNSAKVRLNSGNGFFPGEADLPGLDILGSGVSTTMSANFAATFSFTAFGVKAAVTPSTNMAATMARTTAALRDIDGDGFLDLVASESENGLNVRFSTIRRTNKLKTVGNSLGGTFTIDYAHTTPTYGLPGGKWVMSSVEVDRGIHFPGYYIPVTRTAFTYSGGVRDRREREFLGFAEVVSTDLDTENGDAPYRSVTDSFDVASYYCRGLPLSTTLRDAAGNKYTETASEYYTYIVKPNATDNLKHTLVDTAPSDTWPVAYTPVRYSESRSYEGGAECAKVQTGYTYNNSECGGLVYVFYNGSGGMGTGASFAGYESRTQVSYKHLDSISGRRMVNLPKGVVVRGNDGILYKKTVATYGTDLNAGKVVSITNDINDNESATTRYGYDDYGNLTSVTLPVTRPGHEDKYQYEYDTIFRNTYPNVVTDPHGLATQNDSIDLKYGLPTKITDPNGKVFRTIYDGLGRLKSVKSPNEKSIYSSTIDMRYQPMAVMKADGTGIESPAHAVTTYHLRSPYFTSDDILPQNDTMRVVTFVDGFGRVLQTRKEQVVDDGSGNTALLTVVDGTLEYDGLGRPFIEYNPAQQSAGALMSYDGETQTVEEAMVTQYDVLDRPTKVTQPGRIITRHAYSVEDGLLLATDTDPLGHKARTYSDAAGRTIKTVTYHDAEATQPIETRYLYDPMSRLTTVVNALGDSTLVSYDMLDRRTEVRHPASGTTRWTYDKLGNVLTEENETMRAQGEKIRYTWNVNRLDTLAAPGDTVTYLYGTTEDDNNVAGRVRLRLDRSGGTEYDYDALGCVKYEKRTVVVPQKGNATFETIWDYDSYGKLLRMTYPGGEKLVYRYNASGDLYKVYGGKSDQNIPYVTHIGYDRFGDRVRMVYGNGTVMGHAYDAQTRRLSSDTLKRVAQTRFVRKYTYDKDGNVTRLVGSAQLPYEYNYVYDPQHRLTSSRQRFGTINNGIFATDSLAMSYDDLWRVTRKSQRLSQSNIVQHGTLNAGYDMTYNYDPAWGRHYQMKNVSETHYRTADTPTTADSIRSIHSYAYDPNGNLEHESVARTRLDGDTTHNISERKLLWDGMNRLKAISENGYVSLYWYDPDGNRTVKEHGGGEAIWVNSKHAGTTTDTVTYSIYPNPYISINGNRWTKHYYIGGERVASTTGTISGFTELNDMYNTPAGDGIVDSVMYSVIRHREEGIVDSIYSQLGVPYRALHTNTRGDGWHLCLPAISKEESNDGNGTADNPDNGQLRNHPHTLGDGQVYFYHRDHLGSTMSVTDSIGNTVQQVEYTPWGEVFVERRFGTSGYESPYLFNGKELDEETGLYYYGARYYDPKMSVWYSTDPMEEKTPNINSYCYTANNPINCIDYNGLSTWVVDIGDGKYQVIGGDLNDNDYNIYVYTRNANNKSYIRGNSIGKTLLISSFYNSDANNKGDWAKGSIIDINDNSGIKFIQKVKDTNLSLPSYILNAFNGNKYDFKVTNGTERKIYKSVIEFYRGMPVKTKKGQTFYTSARDIGNIMAGYKAGASGLDWSAVADAFDRYESRSFSIKKHEGFSTRNAEMYGFMLGRATLLNRGKDSSINLATLFLSLFGYSSHK